eukprot:8745603-Karenia_brevis.AAC.1
MSRALPLGYQLPHGVHDGVGVMPGKNRTILLFLDIAAAFPSVAWDYLWRILSACGLPAGLLQFFKALYQAVVGEIHLRGSSVYFGTVESGVVQGCPASAF